MPATTYRSAVALDHALNFGAAEGFVRIFADEGPPMIPLLRHAAARGRHRDYAHRLLAVIDGTAVAPMPDKDGLLSPLSEREVEVLRLVAAGHITPVIPCRERGSRSEITEIISCFVVIIKPNPTIEQGCSGQHLVIGFVKTRIYDRICGRFVEKIFIATEDHRDGDDQGN